MPFTLHRNGTTPLIAAPLLLAVSLCYSGCRNGGEDTIANSPALYGVPKQHFEYCELQMVNQQTDSSGGLSALASVMNYWENEVEEQSLAEKYPASGSSATYSTRKLRRIAIDEGMMAFALTMREQPISQLSEQLKNGRPVITSVLLSPKGYPDLAASAPASAQKRHAIVFGQSDDEFLIMDTGHGVIRMPKEQFKTMWSGGNYAALVCSAF